MNPKVLITGSTKGIGKGILEKFHAENWDVCVSGRDNQLVKKIASTLNQLRENSAIGVSGDLAKGEDNERVFHFIDEIWGHLDCMIFNIGSGKGTKGLHATFDTNISLINVNLINTVKQFMAFLPLLKKSTKPGTIVFIGSIAQHSNVNSPLAYAYSKRALNVFASYQALNLAKSHIRLNVINPGHIFTEDGVWGKKKRESIEEFDEFVSESIPLGNIGKVEDIAEVVFNCVRPVFNNFLTGQTLSVDGGTSLLKGSMW
jgi:3-oxoacyl-[acyl-carrier protein] reductase